MNTYQPETSRIAAALAAVAMTFMTLGALVAAPAAFDAGFADAAMLARASGNGATEVAIDPARIDVIGVRNPNVAWAMPNASAPCKPQV